jgi:flavin-dependent dehydrogenase
MRRCDVLVIGGGPAGAAVAIRLQRTGVRVVLATAAPVNSGLCETLSPRTIEELRHIDVDSRVLEQRSISCHGIAARWGSDRSRFHSHVLDPPVSQGWHIDRAALQALLIRTVRRNNVPIAQPAQVKAVARSAGRWHVSLTGDSGEIETGFLVDATGRRSGVAKTQGIVRRRFDSLCCVSASMSSQHARFSSALQIEAVSYGWWYAAPTTNDQGFVGLVSDADVLARLRVANPGSWTSLFADTGLATGRSLTPALRSHSCDTSQLQVPAGVAWIAVGDAAATFDPLSSFGVLHALISAKEAVAAIIDHQGALATALGRYETTMRGIFDSYLDARRRHYALETRWLSCPFWQRRYTINRPLEALPRTIRT